MNAQPVALTGAERRRVPRFEPQELGAAVFVVGSRLVSIGAHGLMLETAFPVALDSNLSFQLVVGGLKAPVEARVRSCVPRTHGGQRAWGVGVEFLRISETTRLRLDYVLVTNRRGTA
ncbi:MAG: PilZ domain-containing protein [Betaproteobacteria bacterium]